MEYLKAQYTIDEVDIRVRNFMNLMIMPDVMIQFRDAVPGTHGTGHGYTRECFLLLSFSILSNR